jgi:hypothetical protein
MKKIHDQLEVRGERSAEQDAGRCAASDAAP